MNREQRNALKAKVAADKAAAQEHPGPIERVVFEPKENQGKPKKDKGPLLTYRCKHTKPVREIENLDCPACRNEARYAKNRARMEREAAKGPKREIGRLPEGSSKTLRWDGEQWHGVLEVPGVARGFTASESGESKCFHALHARYAEWLSQQ